MEWLAQIISSDVFRGSALLAAVVTGITAVTLQILKRGPIIAKIDDDARRALDESTQAELKRLGDQVSLQSEQVGLQARLHAQCEGELDKMRTKVRKLEDDMNGLRRQLVQYEQTTVTMLRKQETAPKGKP